MRPRIFWTVCAILALTATAAADWREKLFDALVGYSWCAHTTHKHTPTKPRYRLIMPLSRPVGQFEYAFLCRHVAAMIHMDTFDPAGHRWVQAMFWPSVPKDGEYDRRFEAGTWLDPDECMAEYPDWRDVDQWPGADREDLRMLDPLPPIERVDVELAEQLAERLVRDPVEVLIADDEDVVFAEQLTQPRRERLVAGHRSQIEPAHLRAECCGERRDRELLPNQVESYPTPIPTGGPAVGPT